MNVQYNIAWHSTARHGTARHGAARHGTARHGTARHGTAWYGMAWPGISTICATSARLPKHIIISYTVSSCPEYLTVRLCDSLPPTREAVQAAAVGTPSPVFKQKGKTAIIMIIIIMIIMVAIIILYKIHLIKYHNNSNNH